MRLKIKGSYRKAARDFNDQLKSVPQVAETWTRTMTAYHQHLLLDYLESQGRAGGAPPPLSAATRSLYEQRGEPDGSGIRDHIKTEVGRNGNRWWGRVYIDTDKASLIARVQNAGAIIPVTDAMRGFLAAHGIYLKSSTTFIEIPARKFWTNSSVRAQRLARRRLKKILR